MVWTKQGSLQPLSVFTAKTLGMVAATGDPTQMGSTSLLTVGKIYLTRAYVDQILTCNNAYTWVTTAGAGLNNCYLGVYDVATTNLLGKTGDLSTAMQSTGAITGALAAAISGLSYNQELYMAIMCGAGSTTAPTVVANRQFGVNLGMSSDYRFLVSTAATFTALPSTMPATSIPASNASQFIAVGP